MRRSTVAATRTKQPRTVIRLRFVRLFSLIAFVAIWTLVAQTGWMSPISFTGPDRVLAVLVSMARTGELWKHLAASVRTFLNGYLAALVLGVGGGLLLGANRRLEETFGPYVMAFNAAPRVAFIMLILAWFGIGEFSRSLLVFLGVVFPICVNSITGAREVDATLIAAARVFGASRLEMFYKVTLPSAVPHIFSGVQLGVGRGLVGLFLAESYGAQEGIGFLITQAGYLFRVDMLFGGLLVLAALSIALTEGLRVLGKRLTPWYEEAR
jgi:ABC-type nitrate/sulfonate/bicarbonate transport system permease component